MQQLDQAKIEENADEDFLVAFSNAEVAEMRKASALIFSMRCSWVGMGDILDKARIPYDKRIFTEKCRIIADMIVYRYMYPAPMPIGPSTRKKELEEFEKEQPGFIHTDDTDKKAQDAVRYITKPLIDAKIINYIKKTKGVRGVCFQPSQFLLKHYLQNIVNGPLGEML